MYLANFKKISFKLYRGIELLKKKQTNVLFPFPAARLPCVS